MTSNYEKQFRPEHSPQERIRTAVADIRTVIFGRKFVHELQGIFGPGNIAALHDYLGTIILNAEKLEPRREATILHIELESGKKFNIECNSPKSAAISLVAQQKNGEDGYVPRVRSWSISPAKISG